MPENVPGIHHVTAITGDVQRNVDFYVSVLGLRFIKKTVNFDVPDTYHLYFGDYVGNPGTAMTFFGWPHLPARRAGAGQVAAISFAIPQPALEFWAERLRRQGVAASRRDRFGFGTIEFEDPDGFRLELVGQAGNEAWGAWPEGPVPTEAQIRGFHSVTMLVRDAGPTVRFLGETMGFRELGRDRDRTRFETGAGGPRATLDLVADDSAAAGEEAVGTVHHIAWRAVDGAHQLAWREALVGAGRQVTPVIERKYFRSIYSREPGGVLFEIATDGPGFTVDEPAEGLGSALQLPPQYEGRRDNLKFNLPPIVVPVTTGAGR